MKSAFLALGSAALFGLAASQVTDTFALSQCECPETEFSAIERSFFPSSFKLGRNAEDLTQCFGEEGEFPNAPGFTAIFTNEGDSSGFSATANGDLLFLGGSRSDWYLAMRLVLNPADGASIRLLDITSGNGKYLTVDLSTTSESAEETKFLLNFASEFEELNFSVVSSFPAGTAPFDIVIGEGRFEQNTKFGVFSSVVTDGIVEGSSAFFQLLEADDFINLPQEETLSVEMFSGSTDGEPFAIQVHGFQFGRGRFAGFPDSGFINPNDVLEALSFAPVAALPSVDQSQLQRIVPGVQDESIVVDVTRFLVGGDIALEDLKITMQAGELDGTFETDPLVNPFIYTPPKGFVGNQTFSFSYGVFEPYSCFTPNVPITISIVEASSTSYDGDAGTAMLAFLIAALLVAGMIVSARIYSKRQTANDGMLYAPDDQEANSRHELNQGDAKVITV